MTDAEARALLLGAITDVAPEAEGTELDGSTPYAEQLDLDSMDVLNVITAVSEQAGIDIPERDYPRLACLDDAVAYLVTR